MLVLLVSWTSAVASTDVLEDTLIRVEKLAQGPDDKIDVLTAKFAIDRLLDRAFDEGAARQHLDALYAEWVARIPEGASNDAALQLLMDTVYKPGPWNDERPYAYDLNDPYGTLVSNRVLARYLETRRGNCITMPVLLVVLGQRRGLPFTLAHAPTHVLAKYRNDAGQWINIEATSGGTKLDTSYQRELGISDLAMERGIYLQPLSRRESIGLLLGDPMSELMGERNLDAVVRIDETASSLYPSNIKNLLFRRGVLMHSMNLVANHYRLRALTPPEVYERYLVWYELAQALDKQARALGWQPVSDEYEQEYLKAVEKAKGQ